MVELSKGYARINLTLEWVSRNENLNPAFFKTLTPDLRKAQLYRGVDLHPGLHATPHTLQMDFY